MNLLTKVKNGIIYCLYQPDRLCSILVWSLIKSFFSADWTRCRQKQMYDVIDGNIDDDITHERIDDSKLESSL